MSDTFGVTPPAGDPGSAGPSAGNEGGAPPSDPTTVGEAGAAPEGAGLPDPSGSGEGGEGAPAAPSYLDLEQYGDHLVKIKVDGEERELPFSKVRDGLMMQEAFTQRTQELAEERRRLQQADALVAALEADPARTLRELAQVYDFDPDNGLNPIERAPEEQRLVEMQRQMAAQQQQLTQQMIQTEIAAIRAEHGDFDVQATANFARDRGLRLADAYNLMQFEQMKTQQAEAAQQEQRRQAALAAQAAHSGTATQRGTVAQGSGKAPGSIREAWALARQQSN